MAEKSRQRRREAASKKGSAKKAKGGVKAAPQARASSKGQGQKSLKTASKAGAAKKTPARRAAAKKGPARKAPMKKPPVKKAPARKGAAAKKSAPARKTPAKKAPARKTAATKKPAAKRAATKSGSVKKAPAKKAATSKAPAKKAPAKKTPAKKAPAKKAPVSKAPVSKAPAKKATAKSASKKSPAVKTPAKKTPAKKAPAKKAPAKKSASTSSKTRSKKAPAKKSTRARREKKPLVARSDADLLIDRAQRAANLLNFPQAKSIYEQVIGEFPEDVRGYVYYAQLMATLGHRDAALKEFNRALRRQPESFIALAGKAEFLENPPNPNLNDALKIYNTIYELSKGKDDPELAKQAAFAKDRLAYCEARKLSLQSRRYLKSNSSSKAIQKAKEMLQEALKIYPGDKRNYMNLGVAHLRLEEFSRARDVFLKAIEIDHKYARAFLNLGRSYHGLGHLRRARDAFRSCVSLTARQADSNEARANFIQVEREMAQQRADFYDFLLGRSQEEGGPAPMNLPSMKDVITMLTGDDILQADVARLDNASYTILAFSERKRYRVSPGPEGLNIEQDMITVV